MHTKLGDTALVIKCSKCDSEIVLPATAASGYKGVKDQECVVCRAPLYSAKSEFEIVEGYKYLIAAAEKQPSKIFLRVRGFNPKLRRGGRLPEEIPASEIRRYLRLS